MITDTFDQKMTKANGIFQHLTMKILEGASDFSLRLGLAGAVTHRLELVLGKASLGPGVFMMVILSSLLLHAGASRARKIIMQNMLSDLSEHIRAITSNLMNQYHQASEIVANAFIDKDPKKVHDVIFDLIKGTDRSKGGTLEHFFDSRDKELQHLSCEEIKLALS